MVGIVLRDGLCKPNQALVIAHLGGVWNGRRRWPHREGPDVWHRITSWRIPAHHQVCGANTSFWGSVRSAAVVRDRPAARQIAFFLSTKTATSPCRAGSLHRPLRLRASGLFPALQGCGALLYAARRDPMGFRLFLGSSAVEHSTVNRMVAGSNPARGATAYSEGLAGVCGFNQDSRRHAASRRLPTKISKTTPCKVAGGRRE